MQNYWSDADSVSGPGSNMFQTRLIREAIPELLERYGVRSLLDAPCGDMFWIKTLLPVFTEMKIQYHGADIVSPLIEKHRISFEAFHAVFHVIDLTKGSLPNVDLIFTRDCFIHLSYYNIYSILRNYKLSGARYLLTNTYTSHSRKNVNVNGFLLYGRFLNMQKFPFYFNMPLELIVEGCTENDGINADKSLGLWEIKNISLFKLRMYTLLLFLPEVLMRFYNNSIHFLKRLKNFIQRKITG